MYPLIIVNDTKHAKNTQDEIWDIYFDGSCTKQEVGANVVLISPNKQEFLLSFKLNFETTNNVEKYKGIKLGLEEARRMGITQIAVFRDYGSKLQMV